MSDDGHESDWFSGEVPDRADFGPSLNRIFPVPAGWTIAGVSYDIITGELFMVGIDEHDIEHLIEPQP